MEEMIRGTEEDRGVAEVQLWASSWFLTFVLYLILGKTWICFSYPCWRQSILARAPCPEKRNIWCQIYGAFQTVVESFSLFLSFSRAFQHVPLAVPCPSNQDFVTHKFRIILQISAHIWGFAKFYNLELFQLLMYVFLNVTLGWVKHFFWIPWIFVSVVSLKQIGNAENTYF